MNNDWREQHLEIIKDIIQYINIVSNKFILKGGTSLMLVYGLDRFSEDVDMDSTDRKFFYYIETFVKKYEQKYSGLTYRKAKDTDTVKRAFIHYGGAKPLKVEVSYRNSKIAPEEFINSGVINVYTIEMLMSMKIAAFMQRDKLRDLYDICYIYLGYKNQMQMLTIVNLRNALMYKGIEYFDYIIKNQSDELIDNNLLLERFLTVWYDLGLS